MNEPSSPQGPARAAGVVDSVIRFCLENKLIVFLLLGAIVGWSLMVMPFDYERPWPLSLLPRDPVPVDAIPDVGENQQIVFTEWMGRSPEDVQNQITYPLTVSLLGVPGVKTVRSSSMFGFSSIYVVFEEKVDFYWSRSRILERLSVAQKDLPEGVTPALGPDATALGQVFWYTLEGRDVKTGRPIGGWDLDQLRSIQDWNIRYALQSAEGISEVASVGGFVKEYQVDVDPDAMRAYGVTLAEVFGAVRKSNIDVGARTIEVNNVEYVIRGLGFLRSVEDLENTVVKSSDNVPVYVGNVAHVSTGPALRRGALDKGGAEAVGGVVVVRYGENPLEAIKHVKEKIGKIEPGLPSKAIIDYRKASRAEVAAFAGEHGFEAYDGSHLDHDAWKGWMTETPQDEWPAWLTGSQVRIVPFYDRTQLIHETLGTLENALTEEIMVTVIVVIVMVMHLRSSALISALLPLAVMMAFIAMWIFGVDSNVMSLSGIAIAIGTMVDMGIILCENVLRHLDEAEPEENRLEVILRAAGEVGRPVLTAILTTVVSFLPVFAMTGEEGKLFKPLAFTKTFALLASVIVALTLIPPFAHLLFSGRTAGRLLRLAAGPAIMLAGVAGGAFFSWWVALILILWGASIIVRDRLPERFSRWLPRAANVVALAVVLVFLTQHWMPLGPEKGLARNLVFIGTMIGTLLGSFLLFQRLYEPILRFFLAHKIVFYMLPTVSLLLGVTIWLGPALFFGRIPQEFDRQSLSEEALSGLSTIERYKYRLAGLRKRAWEDDVEDEPFLKRLEWELARNWNGMGNEFMPDLDEGSYLFMPTTNVHASIGECTDVLRKQDMAIQAIPEVELVVGKIGRVESPLDPAPISMVETIVNYKPEYLADEDGHRLTFAFDPARNDFFRDPEGTMLPAPDGMPYAVRGMFRRDADRKLIPDPDGMVFRLWRPPLDPAINPGREPWPGIRKPDDIWDRIVDVSKIPGTTIAPKLQPIETRLVMLQSGVKAPMAVRILGQNLEDVDEVGLVVEELLGSGQVAGVNTATVHFDRIVGKPYLEIHIDRRAIARYGISVRDVQDVIETAVGGRRVTTTVEGRERYPVRVRYQRELRNTIESLQRILIAAGDGSQIPLEQLATIRYERGPQIIKTEDTQPVGYVTFDKLDGFAEVDVVEACDRYLREKIRSEQNPNAEYELPAGTAFPTFIGRYQSQVRAAKTLLAAGLTALVLILIIIYLQFRALSTTVLILAGIFIACSGGFIMLWLYSTPWFLDFSVFGESMRELFQVKPYNLSVAVWVGFIALLGIATDDGVVIASYLNQSFGQRRPGSKQAIRNATVEAGRRRIRPCLITTATTILALIPVLTSTGRGSDVMVPMAIPSFGGMTIELMTLFFVPVSYCLIQEVKLKLSGPPK
ncbi:MAG: efflux RND transporter permease subunit [Planctomycetota bacterium]|jgi:Cu(I)/Ag(I) efflux system membrane protein CusA/SilA